MSTVYLLQSPTIEKDLTSAAQFGKIFPIFESDSRPSNDKIFDRLYSVLENFNEDEDYLCAAGGDPLLEFFAGAVMMNLNMTEVMHLVWNRERDGSGQRNGKGFYLPKKINLKRF